MEPDSTEDGPYVDGPEGRRLATAEGLEDAPTRTSSGIREDLLCLPIQIETDKHFSLETRNARVIGKCGLYARDGCTALLFTHRAVFQDRMQYISIRDKMCKLLLDRKIPRRRRVVGGVYDFQVWKTLWQGLENADPTIQIRILKESCDTILNNFDREKHTLIFYVEHRVGWSVGVRNLYDVDLDVSKIQHFTVFKRFVRQSCEYLRLARKVVAQYCLAAGNIALAIRP